MPVSSQSRLLSPGGYRPRPSTRLAGSPSAVILLITKLDAPLANCIYCCKVVALPLRFRKDGDSQFAVLLRFDEQERSVLYIYNPAGQLAYQEVFDENCSSLAALPREKGEVLLVGGFERIYEYSPRE